jgi:hypothetical protein
VSDLQGVESADRIILTDPAVLCKDTTRFGPTNFSEAQMIICLEAARRGTGVSTGGVHTMRAGFSLHSSSFARPLSRPVELAGTDDEISVAEVSAPGKN